MMQTGKDRTQTDFEMARRRAFWNGLGSLLSGRSNQLLSWSDVSDALGVRGSVYQGVQAVPLEKIVGSVERYRDFDRAFMPKRDDIAVRWRAIADAHYRSVRLPPVTLYRVGDAYFVVDGHHRVSVARGRGFRFVDARVTEAQARVPVTAGMDAADIEIRGEYTRFLDRTRLDVLRPEQNVQFTVGGAYERLLDHIAVHRHAMTLEQGRSVPEDEAVCDWYDHAYLSLVRLIREKDILAGFPNRTEADLYLWLMDHQDDLREQCGPGVETGRATQHFVDHYAAQPFRRMVHLVREWIAGLSCDVVLGAAAEG
jgi:hypothetical protein